MKISRRLCILTVFCLASAFACFAQASDPFLGQLAIVPYNFEPRGWAFCNGQILSIAQNTALFSLLGTTFGGNGVSTFALPDLRGRVVLGAGQGPGLSDRQLGEMAGEESVTLSIQQMPMHTHVVNASGQEAGQVTASGNFWASKSRVALYSSTPDTTMSGNAVGLSGGSQPHDNMMPYTTLHYIIALFGVFPSRN